MKSTIWKFTLAHGQNLLHLPPGSEMLTAQMQGDVPMLWALVWPGEGGVVEQFVSVYATGETMPDDPGDYIGTIQMAGGSLVFHAFDTTPRGD